MLKFEKFYFTFGYGHTFEGRCQIIYALDLNTAIKLMKKTYGEKWCIGYTEKDWIKMKNNKNRTYPMETPLKDNITQEF